jgi:phage baseplate assembly protein W
MATFVGFSTQNVDSVRTLQINTGVDGGAGSVSKPIRYSRKFRVVDQDLVLQDFINSLNITQGQVPGRPDVGTTLWTFIFEPNVLDTRLQIETEIRRMAAFDPRLIINTVSSYPQGNGILVEVELAITTFNDPMQLQIMFNQNSQTAAML